MKFPTPSRPDKHGKRIEKIRVRSRYPKGKLPVSAWVAMLGVNPGTANQAVFGDTQGLFVWVAGRAASEGDFRRLIDTETARLGLSLSEVADVMLGDKALKERRTAEMDWEQLIASGLASPGLALDDTYYFYEKRDSG